MIISILLFIQISLMYFVDVVFKIDSPLKIYIIAALFFDVLIIGLITLILIWGERNGMTILNKDEFERMYKDVTVTITSFNMQNDWPGTVHKKDRVCETNQNEYK